MELDIETFIYEIQQRPAIWDVASDDYSNRKKKAAAWEDLVNIFNIKTEKLSNAEKNNICQQLQRRWKSLRDSYSRELKIRREVESGSGTRKRPVYVFFNQLSFLSKVIASKETTNSIMVKQELSSTPSSPVKTNQNNKQDVVNEGLVCVVESSIPLKEEREPENDCDRMFLLSLLNPLKQIPEHARFGVKMKLMEIIDTEMKIHCPQYLHRR